MKKTYSPKTMLLDMIHECRIHFPLKSVKSAVCCGYGDGTKDYVDIPVGMNSSPDKYG